METTPADARRMSFNRSLLGYRRAEVDRAVGELADMLEDVERERARLGDELARLQTEMPQREELVQTLQQAASSAANALEEMKEYTRASAERTLAEARAEAREVVRDAYAERDEMAAAVATMRHSLRSALEALSEIDERVLESAQLTLRPPAEASTHLRSLGSSDAER